MDMTRSILVGSQVCLAPVDPERDAEVELRWTHDGEYLRLLGHRTARPLSPAQVRRIYEGLEKPGDEGKNRFYFTIRLLPDERLLGFARIYSIAWAHGTGRVQIGIGDPADRGKGYGGEALKLLLRYTFEEINLYRLSAAIPEYNLAALRLFENAGFKVEVRQRELLHRDGRRWDLLGLGLLRNEWMQSEDALPLLRGER